MNPDKKAFTLAEVLISVLIIGIVASLVIPVLQKEIDDAIIRTSVRKAYSTISEAQKRIIADNGEFKNTFTNTGSLLRLFANYMNVAKICSPSTNINPCWGKWKIS